MLFDDFNLNNYCIFNYLLDAVERLISLNLLAFRANELTSIDSIKQFVHNAPHS